MVPGAGIDYKVKPLSSLLFPDFGLERTGLSLGDKPLIKPLPLPDLWLDKGLLMRDEENC